MQMTLLWVMAVMIHMLLHSTGGGTALEYGDINTASGGLLNSDGDSINFANVNSISDLKLREVLLKMKSRLSLLVNEVDSTENSNI